MQNKVISQYNPHLVTFDFLGKDIPPLADIINHQNNSLKVTIKYNQVAAKYQILVFLTVIF
ncbi:hypothetical protein [Spiroplasma sp. DGKH1]|uniref:hypothetical protein n=1 Tax=Spiroplasma sp. DGKH1 TaxID=3050074 RepID=UPI0034C6B516